MRSRLLLLLLIPLLMVGCATVSTTEYASPEEQAAQALYDQGKFREAAQSWLATTQTTRSPVRDRAFARAADAFQQAGDNAAARQALAQSNRRKLTGEDALIHDMVSARFLVDGDHARDAVPLLSQPPSGVPERLRLRWHRLRASAFEAAGRMFDAAADQAWVLQAAKPHDRSAGARNIERLLAGLDDKELSQRSAGLGAGEPVYAFAARELRKRGLPVPRPVGNQVSGLLQEFPPADADGYRPPAQLAVLLPMSGPLSAAASGVRDGLLAGYYAESRRRPNLRFYDSGGTGNGALAAMKKAVADGAQMVVGPLGRDEVSAIFADGDPDVPVLALNRPQDTPPAGSLSFALLPDDEGLAIADRLATRGLRDVVVFYQNDDSAQRALSAMREELRLRNGGIVGEIALNDGVADLGKRIDEALAKAERPPTALVFLLKSAQAPLVLAQVRGSPLANLPRIATSSIVANGKSANELDGIEFPELPWLLDQSDTLPAADALARSLPSARGASQRLFAFGRDAWSLVAYYERLQSDPNFAVNGATGRLRIDSIGALQREPAWAELSGGRPRAAPNRDSH